MNMTVLAIILILAAAVEILGFTAALFMLRAKLEDIRLEREKFSSNILENLAVFLDGMKKRSEKQNQLIKDIREQSEILKKQYESLDEAYDYMNERYRTICENYSKLLECWSGVEERYSDCYEQLKYQNERFDRFEKYIDEQRKSFWQTEEDIDMDILQSEPSEGRYSDQFQHDCLFNIFGVCGRQDCIFANTNCKYESHELCEFGRSRDELFNSMQVNRHEE